MNFFFFIFRYDCITQFFLNLKEVNYEIQKKIRYIIPMHLSSEQNEEFRNATSCCICRRSYQSDRDANGAIKDPKKMQPCRHHSHISGI